jgi:hypothetical protein
MTVLSRKPIPQLAAIAGAMLLLTSWNGVPPVHSQDSRDAPGIPSVKAPVPPSPPAHSQPQVPDRDLSLETRRQVQVSLSERGFYQGNFDGQFGPRTRQAIRDYQGAIGASATGYLTGDEVRLLLSQLRQDPKQPGCTGPQFLSL